MKLSKRAAGLGQLGHKGTKAGERGRGRFTPTFWSTLFSHKNLISYKKVGRPNIFVEKKEWFHNLPPHCLLFCHNTCTYIYSKSFLFCLSTCIASQLIYCELLFYNSPFLSLLFYFIDSGRSSIRYVFLLFCYSILLPFNESRKQLSMCIHNMAKYLDLCRKAFSSP